MTKLDLISDIISANSDAELLAMLEEVVYSMKERDLKIIDNEPKYEVSTDINGKSKLVFSKAKYAREYLNQLACGLKNAPRCGSEYDSPEGEKYIIMSDTLVTDISNRLENIANDIKGE
jgi:hypothetical protein